MAAETNQQIIAEGRVTHRSKCHKDWSISELYDRLEFLLKPMHPDRVAAIIATARDGALRALL